MPALYGTFHLCASTSSPPIANTFTNFEHLIVAADRKATATPCLFTEFPFRNYDYFCWSDGLDLCGADINFVSTRSIVR